MTDVEDMTDERLKYLQIFLVEQLEIVEREMENRRNNGN